MCFITILQLSVAGGVVGILFLYVERWLYERIPSKYIVWINILTLLTFIVPFFSILMMKDESYSSFYNNTLIVMTGKTEMQTKFYDIIRQTDISNQIVNIWLIGMILYFVYEISYN